MDLNDEILENIYQLAYRLFSPKEIALAIGLPVEDFCIKCSIQDSPESKKYYEGRFQQLNEIREALIKAAKNGSNPAQEQLLQLLQEHNDDIII